MDAAWAYCKYGISYYELQEMLAKHRVSVAHSTIRCRVEFYVPGIESAFGYFGISFLSAIRGTLTKREKVIVALLQREECCPPDVVCRRNKVVKNAYGKPKWIIISGAEGKSIKTNIPPPNNWHGVR